MLVEPCTLQAVNDAERAAERMAAATAGGGAPVTATPTARHRGTGTAAPAQSGTVCICPRNLIPQIRPPGEEVDLCMMCQRPAAHEGKQTAACNCKGDAMAADGSPDLCGMCGLLLRNVDRTRLQKQEQELQKPASARLYLSLQGQI